MRALPPAPPAGANPYRTPRRLRPPSLAAWIVAACAIAWAAPAAAQDFVRPWSPPDADSLAAWAAEARVRFRANQGDTITGENFRAYQIVANAGRRLLKSLGKGNLAQAHAVEAVFDSLGLDTEIAIDPAYPQFVLMMVRNPFSLTAHAAGYLYWYHGEDLRIQGALFVGGQRPRMRVWWTGRSEAPYALGVIDQTRRGVMRLLFLRLNARASHFDLVQYGNSSPVLGGPGEASFSDVNGDGQPEIVAWVRLDPDSAFQPCTSCPPLISERTYAERPEGYELHDVRLLPSPFSTWTQFLRLLSQKEHAAARRLLEDPSSLEQAIAYDWGRHTPGTWTVTAAEEGQPWARWFDMRFKGDKGAQHVRVRFTLKEGRWIIESWKPTPGHTWPTVSKGGGKG
jgi:hypothetical protein